MIRLSRVTVLIWWFLVLTCGQVMAQNCPNGKTAYIWVNGITTPSDEWQKTVTKIKDNFFAAHPTLDATCVIFVPVYNKSFGAYPDLQQSDAEAEVAAIQTDLDNIYQGVLPSSKLGQVVTKFAKTDNQGFRNNDPDVAAVYHEITAQWNAGYNVVLVGHSQGSFLTNAAYRMKYDDAVASNPSLPTLPNQNLLSVVNIATPAHAVADGRQMYTTQCNDAIQFVKFFIAESPLPPNLPDNNRLWPCVAPEVLVGGAVLSPATTFLPPVIDLIAFGTLLGAEAATASHQIKVHNLNNSYMTYSSVSQKQIYRQMEDSLSDPACGRDGNCYLKEDFRGAGYDTNWTLTQKAGSEKTVLNQNAGILQFDTRGLLITGGGPGSNVYLSGQLTLRSRRVFTGQFTANISVNHISGGRSSVLLRRVVDNSIALALYIDNSPGQDSVSTYPAPTSEVLMPTANGFGGWHQVTFTKTDNQVKMSLNGTGVVWASNTSKAMDGYYLELDSLGDNTLLAKDISVVRSLGFIGPVQVPIVTPTIGNIQVLGSSIAKTNFDMAVVGTNIIAGKIQTWVFDTGACASGCRHPDGGVINVSATGLTLHNVQLDAGNHYLKLRNTDSGGWSNSSATFTVSAQASLSFSPVYQSKSVVAGQAVTFEETLQGSNTPAGNANFFMYCVQACPVGFSYNYTYGLVPISANGSLTVRATYTTSPTSVPGTYNFEHWVTLGALTTVTRIAVTVNAPPSNTPTISFAPVSQSKSVVAGQTVSFDAIVQASSTPGGTANFSMYCTQACPAGFSYNYTYGQVAILANGSIATHATFTTSPTSAPGTYNFEHWVTLGSLTTVTRIAVTVTAPMTASAPVLTSWSVNTAPKSFKPFDLTLSGSGFVDTSQGYVCGSTVASSCFAVVTYFFNSGQILLPAVQWNAVGTIYFKVVNPGGLSSGFMTLQVAQ